MASKSMFLYFDTNKVGKLIKRTIKDGFVEIEDKLFMVDEANPLLIKSGQGYKPLYIVKWSNVAPSTNINEKVQKPLEKLSPEFNDDLSGGEMTPEMLRKLTGLKILGNMIKTKPKTELGGIWMLILGLIAGFGILYSLIAFGIIKI
jgi:hypothetical protein